MVLQAFHNLKAGPTVNAFTACNLQRFHVSGYLTNR